MGSGRDRHRDVDRGRARPTCWRSRGPRAGRHVGFEGADVSPEAKPPQPFGGSIPLAKARRPEVLLAWAMNGEPLPVVHGAPLRVVVPGYIGARSVKWLERIEVRSEPWQGYFQEVVYRLLPEDGTPGPGAGMPLGLVALNPTCCRRRMATRSPRGRSRSVATRSRAVSDTSHVLTFRSTAVRAGHRRSCSRISGRGPGATGSSPSTCRPGATRSSSERGTPPQRHSPSTKQLYGTPRGMSTTPAHGSGCEPRAHRPMPRPGMRRAPPGTSSMLARPRRCCTLGQVRRLGQLPPASLRR